jgi:hypothetical protein
MSIFWMKYNGQIMFGPVNVIKIECAWKADKMEILVFDWLIIKIDPSGDI